MPAFIAAWLIGLAPILSATFWQLLVALGIGVASFTGIQVVFTGLHDLMVTQLGGLPAAVVQILGLMQVDRAFNLILSVGIAKFTLKGMMGGAFKSFRLT